MARGTSAIANFDWSSVYHFFDFGGIFWILKDCFWWCFGKDIAVGTCRVVGPDRTYKVGQKWVLDFIACVLIPTKPASSPSFTRSLHVVTQTIVYPSGGFHLRDPDENVTAVSNVFFLVRPHKTLCNDLAFVIGIECNSHLAGVQPFPL